MTTAQTLGRAGRNGDTTIGHLTPGEIVIPRGLIDHQPQLMAAIIKAFSKYGEAMQGPVDWRRYVVGDPSGPTNPKSGAEEFFGPGPGFGGASQGGSFSGGQAASGGVRAVSGGIGGFLNRITPQDVLTTGMGMIPGVGAVLGAVKGYQALTGDMGVSKAPDGHGPQQGGAPGGALGMNRASPAGNPISRATAFARPGMIGIPSGLDLSPGMSSLQQRTAIATNALYGDNSVYRSDEAKDYYKNLLNRDLIGNDGKIGDMGQLMPIESQYLQQVLGLSYQPTTTSLLNAIAAA